MNKKEFSDVCFFLLSQLYFGIIVYKYAYESQSQKSKSQHSLLCFPHYSFCTT